MATWELLSCRKPLHISLQKVKVRPCVCVCVISFHICIVFLCGLAEFPTDGTGCLPSTPILPSPSLSAAFKNALVSLSVRSRPSLAKPFRTNLAGKREAD